MGVCLPVGELQGGGSQPHHAGDVQGRVPVIKMREGVERSVKFGGTSSKHIWARGARICKGSQE